MISDSDERRLWSKIEVRLPDDCWPWIAKSNVAGYGALKVKGKNGFSNLRANRAVLMLATGTYPPSDVHALHSCDNPACCNPRHLRWGTPKDNSRDAWDRGRASPPPIFTGDAHFAHRNPHLVKRGEQIGTSLLTEPEVRAIYKMHMRNANASQISEKTGHTVAVIADVCSGRSWKHLLGTKGAPTYAELKCGGVKRNKLTEDDKAEILRLSAKGMTIRQIAPLFNVSTAPIANLRKHGRTWTDKA